jgi:uncharacterized surface protein with fasciclin (FAS1) repeats
MRLMYCAAAAAALTLCLAACGDQKAGASADGAAAAQPSSRTLAASLKDADQLNALEGAATSSGLASVLDGVGPYTVFAPTDAAFQTAGGAPSGDQMKAQSAALLRAHIVPGALTRADIAAALDRASGDKVEMRTMADGVLTFSRDGQVVVVTGPDGASGRLTGDEVLASNGVIQPVDGVLLKPAAK